MRNKLRISLFMLLVTLFVMFPMTQTQAAEKLQARFDIENCYEGDLQSIHVKVLNPEPGETFTYRWKFNTFAGWSYWRASGNWYTGEETDTITFQTEIGDATCDWEDEWGWLEHGVDIKSSTGRKLSLESIYRPQPKEKYPVYTIIFSGLDEPKVGQKLDCFVESFADYAFEPLGVIWYKGWDDSTTDGYVGPDTVVTSGKYRCRLYFDMVSPYKLGDGANAAVNYSNGIIKYDSEIEKYYILKTYTAIEPVAATITKQPVSSRGSLSTGVRFTIAADNVKTYCWQLYVNSAWHDLANSNTNNYLIFPGKIGDYTLRCKLTSNDGVVSYSNTVGATVYNDAKVSQSAKYVYEGEAVDIAVTDVGCTAKVKYYEWLWKNDKMSDWELCENYEEYFDDDYKTGKLKYRYATEDMLQYHPRFYCIIFFEDGLGTMESEVAMVCPYYEKREGITKDYDGKLKYFYDGEVMTNYNGFLRWQGVWYYLKNGIVDDSFTGLKDYGGYTWYLVKGVVTKDYSGYVAYESSTYVVKDGMVDTSVNGLKYVSGSWMYFKNGRCYIEYSGLVYYPESDATYYVVKGIVDKTFTGLYYNKADGLWYYIAAGRVNKSFAGLVYYEPSNSYYYVSNGTIDKTYTGLAYDTNDKIWYYVINGRKNTTFEGLVYYEPTGEWYYVRDGKIDKSYTGLVYYAKSGCYYYVNKGKVDFTFNGNVTYNGKTYTVVNGKVKA